MSSPDEGALRDANEGGVGALLLFEDMPAKSESIVLVVSACEACRACCAESVDCGCDGDCVWAKSGSSSSFRLGWAECLGVVERLRWAVAGHDGLGCCVRVKVDGRSKSSPSEREAIGPAKV